MSFILKGKSFRPCFRSCYHFSTAIDKVLIANRGEIACRVINTAKKLGIKTVAVFSDADAKAMHVTMADEAYHIGPPPSQESYLRSDKLLSVMKQSGCKAVHPGYGFLSENAEFATACQKEGIIFIGPPATAIRDMGIKSTSKIIMAKAGVPVIQGYHGEDQSDKKLNEEAERIGYPVMIKAVRGGGGKGMRIAKTKEEFQVQLDSARNEALKSFGNNDMLLERFVEHPRHVEVQVFGDMHGNYLHLFERDCSVQRRHQKIIEEAPAPGLSTELRQKLGNAATQAAQAVGYIGAGTVEFILDKNTHEYYFMEMNTRLQVEHPVTEMVTNTDLVEWQFKVASGEKLPLRQEDVNLRGHAFEARIYAEDPDHGFLPGAGNLKYLRTPSSRSDVRIETGVRQGDDISVYYDPMIAKLVVWGSNRLEALQKFSDKLTQFNVAGLETNINFLLRLARHSEFKAGNVHTNFIPDHESSLFSSKKWTAEMVALSVLSQISHEHNENLKNCGSNDPFVTLKNFRLNHHLVRKFEYVLDDGVNCDVEVTFLKENKLKVRYVVEGPENEKIKNFFEVDENVTYGKEDMLIECRLEDKVLKARSHISNNEINIFSASGRWKVVIPEEEFETSSGSSDLKEKAVSPMPGVVDKVFVKKNDKVNIGDPLMTIIAMKMEYIIKSPKDGLIQDVLHSVGDSVAKNSVLVKFAE